MKLCKKMLLYILTFFLIPVFTHAHILSGEGFGDGALHPLTGLDHLLAMVAVGIVSVRLGGKYVWMAPLIFVASMIAGGLLGIMGVHLPYVEIGIAFSVLFSGLAIALSRRLPTKTTISLTILSAIFHGHAHGSEMSAILNPVLYVTGFILSTAALHISGVLIGQYSNKSEYLTKILRYAGAGISAAGVYFLIAV